MASVAENTSQSEKISSISVDQVKIQDQGMIEIKEEYSKNLQKYTSSVIASEKGQNLARCFDCKKKKKTTIPLIMTHTVNPGGGGDSYVGRYGCVRLTGISFSQFHEWKGYTKN